MKKQVIFIFIILISTCLLSSLIGQETAPIKHKKWGIKVGITQIMHQVRDEPLTGGRGLGCSAYHVIEDDRSSFGGKVGLFYEFPLFKKSSLIIGPEVLFTNSQKQYNSGLKCIFGPVSDSNGALKSQNFTFHFPILFRQETSFFDVFFEIGGYHDLSTGMSSTYEYTSQTFINDMFQELPEPLIGNDSKTINGSNFGLIFGLGNKGLLAAQNLELRCLYYHSLSKSVPLGEYRYISQSGLDLSVNYRF